MDCCICFQEAEFMCKCSNVYLCSVHIGNHLGTKGNHKTKKTFITLNPEEKQALSVKIKLQLSLLKHLKEKISSETKKMIRTLELKSNELLIQINSHQRRLSFFLSRSNFQQSLYQKIESVLSSEMILLNDFNPVDVIKSIHSLFNQGYFEFESNSSKVHFSKKKQFLDHHNGGFTCLAVVANSNLIVTGSDDCSIRFWDLDQKLQKACLNGHKSSVSCLSVSQENFLVVSGSFDKKVIVWDAEKLLINTLFSGHSRAVNTVAFCKNSKFVVSGCRAKELFVWDASSGQPLKKLTAQSVICCGVTGPDDIFYSGVSKNLVLWNLQDFTEFFSIKAHDSVIRTIALTRCSKFIITGSSDKSLKIWENDSKSLYARLVGHNQAVCSVSSTSVADQIISSSEDMTMILWSLEKKALIHRFSVHRDHVYSVTGFNDLILSASRDSRIGIIRHSTLSFESFLHLKTFTTRSEHLKDYWMAFGSLNKVVVTDIYQRQEVQLEGHSGLVQTVQISSGQKLLLSGSRGVSKNLIVWDFQLKKKLAELVGHESSVFCVDISTDELFAASGDSKGVVRIWDLNTFNCEFAVCGHKTHVYSVIFSKNRRFAVSGGLDSKVIVWNLLDMQVFALFNGHSEAVWKVLVTEDEKFVVSGDYFHGVKVWNLAQKRLEFDFCSLNQAFYWLNKYKSLQVELESYLF